MRKIVTGFGALLGLYLIARAAVEPFVIDMTDPVSYREDWGGPSLAGVLAVHCGPGLVSAVLIGWGLRSWWRGRAPRGKASTVAR
ncbi:hypothetical protein AB0C02_07310 [Micromonospora sp. NPDC048999]|uniref:hypothetical protein n=1 Tax=Micromonospora sp. NPDC048999 TaxID=3155391 RepID=UPI00340A725F